MSGGCQSGQHKTQLEVLPCFELVVACFWPQNHKKRLKMGHFRAKTRSNSGQQCILPRVNLDQMQLFLANLESTFPFSAFRRMH